MTITCEPPRLRAIAEIEEMILARFPDARFEVHEGVEHPDERWVVATAHVEDADDILQAVLPRMVDLQVHDGIPLYVMPLTGAEVSAARR